MNRSAMPSLAALLGLLAVAGYQNRDKLKELINGLNVPAAPGAPAGPLAGVVKGVTDMFGGQAGSGSVLGGLSDIVDRFRNAGHGPAADSWVATGPNQPVTPAQTETALGGDLIDMLVKQTGLSREELLKRLAQIVPEAVDKATPAGTLAAPQG